MQLVNLNVQRPDTLAAWGVGGGNPAPSFATAMPKAAAAASEASAAGLQASRADMNQLMPGYQGIVQSAMSMLSSYGAGGLTAAEQAQYAQKTAERNMLQGRSGGAGQTLGYKVEADELTRRRELAANAGMSLFSTSLQDSIQKAGQVTNALEWQLNYDAQMHQWDLNKGVADAAQARMLQLAGQGMGGGGTTNGRGGGGGRGGSGGSNDGGNSPFAIGGYQGMGDSTHGGFMTQAEVDAFQKRTPAQASNPYMDNAIAQFLVNNQPTPDWLAQARTEQQPVADADGGLTDEQEASILDNTFD